jgi:unsaturated chondroitin disaccharide hydrolase
MMWIFERHAQQENGGPSPWREQAIRYSKPLEARKEDKDGQDLGFLFLSTYHRWFKFSKETALNEVLIAAGRTMAQRFQEKGGYLPSFISEDSLFIDIMMNVGIIFYAARETGDRKLRDIAIRHCLTTRRYLVRGDGSTAHEGIFDVSSGEFLRESTQQGYRADSCWSRGLAWAMYGFTVAYEYTRDPRFLQTAEACANYFTVYTHADGVPPWDFNAPANNRQLLDTSAAAIAAAAFLRLRSAAADRVRSHFYWSSALLIVRTLCQKYLARKDKKWEGILRGGVYHIHKELGVDESVMWGEYFFVEALEEVLRQI